AGDADADELGQQPGAAGRVGADEVALDLVAGGAGVRQEDAVVGVGGDDVARAGGTAADEVVARPAAEDDAEAVGGGGVAGRGRADVVAADDVAASAVDEDAVAGEQVDDQPLHRAAAAAGRDGQAVGARPGQVAAQDDDRRPGKARLARAVDD